MKIHFTSRCHVGLVRPNNEDACTFCPDLSVPQWYDQSADQPQFIPLGAYGAIGIVADGMGGANAGEVASSIAIQTLCQVIAQADLSQVTRDADSIRQFLTQAIGQANEAVITSALSNPDAIGLGTTLVIAWVIGQQAHVAWCGDSRCYLFQPTQGLRRLTHDHSYVQQLVDAHQITPEQAVNHPDSNQITRCLGDCDVNHTPEFVTTAFTPGSTLLLCSDGLCGYSPDSDFSYLLYADIPHPTAVCQTLQDLALTRGGYDNIAVMLITAIADADTCPTVPFSVRLKKFVGLV